MFFAVILSQVLAAFQDLRYGDSFNPLIILWPSSWVSSRVSADSNYAGTAKNIYLYFSVDSLTLDLSQSYMSIQMPNANSSSVCSLSPFGSVKSDWKATCPFTFTSSSIYGPINLILFKSATGQIIGQDFSFGYLALLSGSEDSSGSLSVSYTNSSATHTVQTPDFLSFSFSLPDSPMYPGDYITVKADPKFSASQDLLSLTWDPNTTSSSLFINTQPVLVVDSNGVNWVYIAGLSNKIPGKSLISFVLGGWVNPQTAQSGVVYTWKAAVRRFGADTLLKSYSGSGPSGAVTAGSIYLASFAPYTSAFGPNSSLKIAAGMANYWTVSFSTQHDIPGGGSISLMFSGVTINDYSSYSGANNLLQQANGSPAFFVSFSDSALWTSSISAASSTQVSILLDPSVSIPSGTGINFSAILKITKDPTISSIDSLDSSASKIDSFSAGKSVGLQSSGISVVSPSTSTIYTSGYLSNFTTQSNRINTVGFYDYGGFVLNLKLSVFSGVTFAQNDVIYIYLPIQTGSSATESNIVFPSTYWAYQADDSGSNPLGFGITQNFSPNPIPAAVLISTGVIKLTLLASIKTNAVFFIGAGSPEKNLKLFTPVIPQKIPGEIIVKFTISSVTYYWSTTISFQIQSISPSLSLICYKVSVAGTPVKISYTLPNTYTLLPGYTLQVTLMLQQNSSPLIPFSASNLNNYDLYPCSDPTRNLYILSPNKIAYNATSYPYTQEVFSVPILTSLNVPGNTPAGPIYVTVSAYVISTINSVSYQIATGANGNDASATPVSADYSTDGTTGLGSSNTYSLTSAVAGSTITSPSFSVYKGDALSSASFSYLLILPPKWTTSDLKLTGPGSVSLVSKSSTFPFSVYYKQAADSLTGTSLNAALSLTAPWYIPINTAFTFAVTRSSAFPQPCTIVSYTGTSSAPNQANLIVTAGTLVLSNYSPDKAKAYTYNSRTVPAVSFSFKSNTTDIGLKSSITISLSSQWTGTSSSGWTVLAGSLAVPGTVSGSVWTSSPTTFRIPVGTSITVSVTGATSPQNQTASFVGVQSISISYSNTPYLTYIGTEGPQTTILNSTLTIQKSSQSTVWVFPNVPGSKAVYFGLSFQSTYLIPAGATISIAGSFAAQSSVNQGTWTSHNFKSANVNSGTLAIVTSQDILAGDTFNLLFDLAFDISSKDSTSVPVYVVVFCNDTLNTTVINDNSINNTLVPTYSISTSPNSTIQNFKFKPNTLQAGWLTWYSFSFSLSTATSNPIWVLLDACGDYQAVPGPSFTISDYGSGYRFLYAYDGTNNTILCNSVHWVTYCYVTAKIAASATNTLNVYMKNGQSSGYFNIYITDTNNNLIFQPAYGSAALLSFVSSFTTVIDVLAATPDFSSYPANDKTDLNLSALLNISSKQGESFVVQFPPTFNLDYTNPATVLCSMQCYNSDDFNITITQIINKTSCPVSKNNVNFILPNTSNFTSANWTVFSLYGIQVPDSGYSRTKRSYEVPPLSSFYTSNFRLFYQDSSNSVLHSSFDNLNGAFFGFSVPAKNMRLVVNNNLPITLTAGTWNSPYTVSLPNLVSSISAVLKGTPLNLNISLSSNGSYSLSYTNPTVSFSIGTSINTPLGSYIIQWSLSKISSNTGLTLLPPVPTIVLVSKKNTFNVLLSTSQVTITGKYQSYPVSVYIDQSLKSVSPFSGISIKFTPSAQNISVIPSSLSLTPVKISGFFVVNCSNCSIGDQFSVNLTLSGTDSAVFTIPSQINIDYQSNLTAAAVVNASLDWVRSNGFVFNLKSDSQGIVTWALVSELLYNSSNYTYSDLLKNTYVFGAQNNSKLTGDQQIAAFINTTQNIINSGLDYTSIITQLVNAAKNVSIVGQSLISAAPNTLYNFNFLAPGLKYYVIAFTDNLSGNLTQSLLTATTSPFPSHASLSIELSDLDPALILSSISAFFKWNQKFISVSKARQRNLATALVYIYADPQNNVSPYQLANANSAELNAALGGSVVVNELTSDNYSPGEFYNFNWVVTDGAVFYLEFTSKVDGLIICTFEGNGLALTTQQVFNGLNATGSKLLSLNWTVSQYLYTEISVNFTKRNLTVQKYGINCVVCNSFPGIPSCSLPISSNYSYTGVPGISFSLYLTVLTILTLA